jgi:hypothetical protein
MFNFLVFSWALTFGLVPYQIDFVENKISEIDANRIATFAAIDFGVVAFDRLHVYTEIETFQYPNDTLTGFNPYRADYIFGIDFYINKNISVGMNHECDHPIISRSDFKPEYNYLSAETKLFVRIGSENNNP